jgi:hypothetical protein
MSGSNEIAHEAPDWRRSGYLIASRSLSVSLRRGGVLARPFGQDRGAFLTSSPIVTGADFLRRPITYQV